MPRRLFDTPERVAAHPVTQRSADIRTIVVGVDDSSASRGMIDWCAHLAHSLGAQVDVVHAVSRVSLWVLAALQIDTTPILRGLRANLRDTWTHALRDAHVSYRTWLVAGSAAHELARIAQLHAPALIVLGAARHHGGGDPTIGSTGRRLTRNPPCPIAFVPSDPDTDAIDE